MVFKPDYRSGFFRNAGCVSYHALFACNRKNIYSTYIFTLCSVRHLIIMPQQLIASADSEKCLPVFCGGFYIIAFTALQIFHQKLLLKILTSPYEDQVIIAERIIVSVFYFSKTAVDAAPLKPLFHTYGIPPIPVEIQQIGIEMAYLQFHFSFVLSPLPLIVLRISHILSIEV